MSQADARESADLETAPTLVEEPAAGGDSLVAAGQAPQLAQLVRCRRCEMVKKADSKGVWKSKKAWWCSDCNATTSKLARAYDGLPETWASTSEAAKVEFFKRCKAKGQHLAFDRVRSLLVDALTSTVTEAEKTSVAGGYQPLSWWAQQGYDVEAVEKQGDRKDHDVFGAAYYVPIEYKSKDKVKETIHQQLLQLERQVKKRSQKQARLADEAAPTAPRLLSPMGQIKRRNRWPGPNRWRRTWKLSWKTKWIRWTCLMRKTRTSPQRSSKRKMAQGRQGGEGGRACRCQGAGGGGETGKERGCCGSPHSVGCIAEVVQRTRPPGRDPATCAQTTSHARATGGPGRGGVHVQEVAGGGHAVRGRASQEQPGV